MSEGEARLPRQNGPEPLVDYAGINETRRGEQRIMNQLNKRDFLKATALLGTAAVVPAASLAADEGEAAPGNHLACGGSG